MRYPRPVFTLRRSPAFAGDLLNGSQAVVRRLGQRRRLGGQVQQRPGHQEHHHQVEDRGEAQGEGESLHLADRQEVQHGGGQEGDGVARHDRLAGPHPAARHRRPERTAFADLVFDAFEEHHERVGGGTDTDDQTRDAGQVQGVVDISAQQHQDRENHCAGSDQRQRREQTRAPGSTAANTAAPGSDRSRPRSGPPAATSIPMSPRRFGLPTIRRTAAATRTSGRWPAGARSRR